MRVGCLDGEDPLEEGTATGSSILAWEIPRTERGAWWASVCRVTESRAGLKRLTNVLS